MWCDQCKRSRLSACGIASTFFRTQTFLNMKLFEPRAYRKALFPPFSETLQARARGQAAGSSPKGVGRNQAQKALKGTKTFAKELLRRLGSKDFLGSGWSPYVSITRALWLTMGRGTARPQSFRGNPEPKPVRSAPKQCKLCKLEGPSQGVGGGGLFFLEGDGEAVGGLNGFKHILGTALAACIGIVSGCRALSARTLGLTVARMCIIMCASSLTRFLPLPYFNGNRP